MNNQNSTPVTAQAEQVHTHEVVNNILSLYWRRRGVLGLIVNVAQNFYYNLKSATTRLI